MTKEIAVDFEKDNQSDMVILNLLYERDKINPYIFGFSEN